MKSFLTICVLALVMTFAVPVVFAVETPAPDNKTTLPPPDNKTTLPPKVIPSLQNPLQTKDIQGLLATIVDLAIFIGLIMAVLVFIWIGFKFVMAQGNDSSLKEAKTWFLYAVIGTAVLISAKVIVDVIKSTFVSAGVVNESLFKKP